MYIKALMPVKPVAPTFHDAPSSLAYLFLLDGGCVPDCCRLLLDHSRLLLERSGRRSPLDTYRLHSSLTIAESLTNAESLSILMSTDFIFLLITLELPTTADCLSILTLRSSIPPWSP